MVKKQKQSGASLSFELFCLFVLSICNSERFSSPPGVTSTNHVSDEATVQIYFQSDLRAAGIKDVVRNFIKKAKMVRAFSVFKWFFLGGWGCVLRSHATMGIDRIPAHESRWKSETALDVSAQALAIVMECFSDVELLCDILEACIKRNVSVHLLLDRSNLAQFVDMWHDLKLVGKNFPVSLQSFSVPLIRVQPNVSKHMWTGGGLSHSEVTQGCCTSLELNKHRRRLNSS